LTLNSPYKNVREDALEKLGNCEFSAEQAEKVVGLLEKSLYPCSFWKKMNMELIKFLKGTGYIGGDPTEKIRIIHILSSLKTKDSKELEFLLIKFLDRSKNESKTNKPWHILMQALLEFPEELSTDIATKIIELYFHNLDEAIEKTRYYVVDNSFIDPIFQLCKRFNPENKRRIELSLLERFEKAESERAILFFLNALSKLWDSFSPEDMGPISAKATNKILALNKNKNWSLSNLAFELIILRELV
jgi:hypothetical protein